MSVGDFIEIEQNLEDRNAWLQANAPAVAPYLRDGRECTLFTFTRQEPADRCTTRIGGLPYWPRGLPWPVCGVCSKVRPATMVFIAQLDVRDTPSHEGLPGDVLTLHGCLSCYPTHADDVNPDEADAFRQRHNLRLPALDPGLAYVRGGLHLTWHSTATEVPLIAASELPAVVAEEEWQEGWHVGPFYGTAHRAVDYPTPPEAYDSGIAGERYTYLMFTLQGTKIGGYPPPIQDFDVPLDSTGRPMQFLGTIGSVTGNTVDGTETYSEADGTLMWGDMGCLYHWIAPGTDPMEMSWFTECY